MKQRLISAFLGVILFLVIIFSEKYVLMAAVLTVIEIALFEMYRAVGILDKKILAGVGMAVPIFILFGFMSPKPQSVYFAIWLYLAVLFAVLIMRHNAYSFTDISKFFMITVLVSLLFSHAAWIRQTEHGLWNTFAVFVGAWITDSCAYFAGRAFGKHKLAPVISPKKTIEGSVGGFLGTAAVMCLYGYLVGRFTSCTPQYIPLLILGLLCGVVSQLGDLSASAIKREYGIKDYGKIMPGHGGVMDRFDSVLFVAPLVYHFISVFPIFI